MFRRELASWLSLDVVWIQGAVLVSATMVVTRIRLGQWQVRKQARSYAVFQVSQGISNVSLSLLLVVALHQGYHGRLAAQVGVAAVFAAVALVLLHREQLLALWVWRPSLMREALAHGVPLLPHIAGGFLLGSMDRLIVNRELGVAEVGIYVVAAQLAHGMRIVFDGINKAFWPWLFERLKEDDIDEKRRIVRLTYAWYAVILVTVALVFLVGPPLLRWIAGDRYARAGEIIGWLALGEAFGGMYLMVTNYIFYAKRTGLVSIASIAGGAANVVLLIAFIRWFGLHGAAWAFCSAMGIRFLLTWWAAHHSVPMPWFGRKEI
jgi:O-antigen/teichoic acid export membrane protein